jgi:membrane peptidoglycan carboxypeptidase
MLMILIPKGKGDKIIQSAMIVIDPSSGEIRGLIGEEIKKLLEDLIEQHKR